MFIIVFRTGKVLAYLFSQLLFADAITHRASSVFPDVYVI
jgi:hypothetical protein